MTAVGIHIQKVSKEFENGVLAIENFSTSIAAGEFVAILGPSGCGKSTLLRMISGVEKQSSGNISWDEKVPPRLGYVFQDAHLLPWKTVYENVALALRLHHESPPAIESRVRSALEMVGLADFASAYPAQLSGGMKMRVSLCRALVNDPQVLLLDEPFAALDEFTRQNLDEELHRLWIQKKMTVIFVTHSISEAAFLANRYLVLSKRPARILADLKSTLPSERNLALKVDPSYFSEIRKLTEAFHA